MYRQRHRIWSLSVPARGWWVGVFSTGDEGHINGFNTRDLKSSYTTRILLSVGLVLVCRQCLTCQSLHGVWVHMFHFLIKCHWYYSYSTFDLGGVETSGTDGHIHMYFKVFRQETLYLKPFSSCQGVVAGNWEQYPDGMRDISRCTFRRHRFLTLSLSCPYMGIPWIRDRSDSSLPTIFFKSPF